MKTLIKNGLVVDPANRICSKLNILIEDGKIKDITTEEPMCDRSIDASGKIVAPGFIDIHMHEEKYDEATDTLKKDITFSMLKMGVTSAFGGNCGTSNLDPIHLLDIVDRDGCAVNMGMFAGYTYYREKAGASDKYAAVTKEQLKQIVEDISIGLSKDCFGISFGIRYVPGTTKEELIQVGKLCCKDKKLISAHVRDDADYIFDAMDELIDIGTELNIPVQVSHIGSMGGFGQMEKVLSKLDAIRGQGFDVTADCYPYYAFSTGIGETTYDDGFLERYDADYSCIEFCEGKYKGQRATKETFEEMRRDEPQTLTVCYVMKPQDVDRAILHPGVMLASDGLRNEGQGHPRAAGSFPRLIDKYVKTGKMSIYDAIDKMTAMPASKLGLTKKGRLNKGADADIVIFDLKEIEDRATFDEPNSTPKGINYVIIDGEIACRDGKIENAHLGKSIRYCNATK